ncbi:hypothetical protein UB44_23280 [Burkholderiaceae bacterium 26]|nr:hypothetical protein UB44_23280 [Burkholderiaceae bacterium 26]
MAASRLGDDALPFVAGNALAEHLDQEVAQVLTWPGHAERGLQTSQFVLQTRDPCPRFGLLQ